MSPHAYSGIAATSDVQAKADVRSYADALLFLRREGHDPQTECDARLASNVYVIARPDYLGILLYNTEVVRYYSDGTFSVDNDGYNTPTTSRRVNQFTPRSYHFWHEDGILTCECPPGMEHTHRRFGMKRLRCSHEVRLPENER